MTTLYISGPMTGYPELHFPAFHSAARTLRQAGYLVINPAENFGGEKDVDRRQCLRHDIQQVLIAEGIATLSGWTESSGARLEVAIAEALGLPIQSVDEWLDEASAPSVVSKPYRVDL